MLPQPALVRSGDGPGQPRPASEKTMADPPGLG